MRFRISILAGRNKAFHGGDWEALTKDFDKIDFQLPDVWPTPYADAAGGRHLIDIPIVDLQEHHHLHIATQG